MKNILFTIACIACFINFHCTSTRKIARDETIHQLHFLSEFDIPYNYNFNQTIVSGLSGFDYDAASNIYYLISDDRSDNNPARFYKAVFLIKNNSIDSFIFTGVTFLKNNVGNTYPNSHNDPSRTPDPEAMRYAP